MSTNIVKVEKNAQVKLPPQSLEAEEAILGAVLTNPVCLNKVIEYLQPATFYKPAHRTIYSAILNLYANNHAIDIVTVSEMLREQDKLEAVGGRAYINDLALGVTTTANVEYYAKIVQEKAIKRSLINAGSEIVSMAYDGRTTEDVLDNAERLIFDIAQQRSTSDLESIKNLVVPTFDKIEYRYNHRDMLTGISTGFYDLDEMTSGLQKSDLIILAARPSMGKTAFALNIAQHVGLKERKPVAIFSLEMPKEQLVSRMMCSEAEVDSQNLKTGNMGSSDWARLTQCMNVFMDAPIYIDDTSGVTVMDIRAKCRRLAMQEKDLALIIIDYLQLIICAFKIFRHDACAVFGRAFHPPNRAPGINDYDSMLNSPISGRGAIQVNQILRIFV